MDARERRRERTRDEILDAAWRLAERHGIAGLTLRDLAREVGMRAPSLYTYFDAKGAIHDAMFAAGYRDLLAVATAAQDRLDPADVEGSLRTVLEVFLDFCEASVPRYQLMFTRVLPDWQPSAEAYAPSIEVFELLAGQLQALGIDERGVDVWTALASGLAAQQVANDLGGDRWRRLVPDVVAMFVAHHVRADARA